jgi:hypothetical protein
MVFTGPPTDRGRDAACVERLLAFAGRKVVCGGTTGQIAAERTGRLIDTDSPLLPKSVSIRRSILDQLASLLGEYHKAVEVEWC